MELESASMRGELGAVGDSLQPQTPSRHEKSLGLLTTKFVTLLQEAKDGVLDLKAVSVERPESLLLASTCHVEPAFACLPACLPSWLPGCLAACR